MRNVLVIIAFVLCASQAQAQVSAPKKSAPEIPSALYPNIEINIFGASWHENRKTQQEGNLINPGLGIRYNFSEHYYVEANYILRNTTGGRTPTAGFGYHTRLFDLNGVPLKGGLQVVYMEYENKTRGATMRGILPMITLRWGEEGHIALVAGIFLKKGDSVVITAVQVPLPN